LIKWDFESFEERAIASFLVTIVFVTPHLSRLDERIEILSIFRSLAIIVPWLFMYDAI